MSRRAIVSGATGFIGSNLCRRLADSGWQVFAPVRGAPKPSRYLEMIQEDVVFFDCNCAPQTLVEWVAGINADAVFHLATLFRVEHTSDDIHGLMQGNIEFGTLLLEGHLRSDKKLFINTGTSWQHYQNEAYNPVCLYAATKEAFENILTYYTAAEGVRAITLKLFDSYGGNDSRPKLINLLRSITKEHDHLDLSPGEQILDLVHIDDITRAFLDAIDLLEQSPDIHNETYAVSSGQQISLRELVSLFERVNNVNLHIRWGGRPYRKREVMTPWLGGHPLPNWKPSVELRDGLIRFFSPTDREPRVQPF